LAVETIGKAALHSQVGRRERRQRQKVCHGPIIARYVRFRPPTARLTQFERVRLWPATPRSLDQWLRAAIRHRCNRSWSYCEGLKSTVGHRCCNTRRH
jgi:hypothetical protein